MDIKTRRDASRGRKSKAGGGNQKRLKNIHPSPPVRDMLQVFERGHLPIFSHSTPKGSPAYGKTVPKKI